MARHNYKHLLAVLTMVCLAMPAYATIVGMMKMPDTSKKSNGTAKETPEGFGDQREGGGTRWIDPVILYNLQDVNRTDYTRAYDQGDIDVNKEIVEKGYKIYGIRIKPICAAGYVKKFVNLTYLVSDRGTSSISYQDMYGVSGVPLNEAGFCIYPDEATSRIYSFEYTATGNDDVTHHEDAYNSITISGLRFVQNSNGIAFSYALTGKANHVHKCKRHDPSFSFTSKKNEGINAKFGHFIYFKGARDLLLILGAPGKLPAEYSYATELRTALENHPWGRVYFIVEQVQVDAGVVAAVEGVELQSHESETAEVDETEEEEVNADEGEEAEDGVNLTDEIMEYIQNLIAHDPLGLDRQATPGEAIGIGTLATLLAILLGGGALGGGVGGGLGGMAGGAGGGTLPPPIEGAPSGPPPISNPYQGIENKYVTRHPDGSITVKDPVTGEPRLYVPDGQGGYDDPMGGSGGYKNEEAMLDHLAYLDRNKYPLSQDAETAARNQAEQRAQWDAMNARDLERGFSDEMADYRDWKAKEEQKLAHEIYKDHLILKLASKYGVEATEEKVRKALKKDMIEAGVESAKQQAESARNDMIIVGLESTKNVAATSLVLIPMALSGIGTVSAATMVKAKIVQSVYTMSTSIIDKVGDAYVKGENMGMAAVHGAVTGTVSVAQNYAGDMGGWVTEAAVVIGGEGFKAGYEEFTTSGDLNKTLDATLHGLKEGTKNHALNKTMEFGLNKAKKWATSGKSSAVDSTRAQVDSTGKTLTSSKQAATQAQNKLTTAQQRANAAQQTVTRSQQLVAKAKGDVNAANKDLKIANKQLEAAQNKLKQANTDAARAELNKAQRNAEMAQQNFNRANKTLEMTEKTDAAAKRVAVTAEHQLQSAQFGAQKAQSDLKTATAQHEQALRNAYAAEQQAQVDKLNDKMQAHVSSNDIVTGGRAVEDFVKNTDKISKGNK